METHTTSGIEVTEYDEQDTLDLEILPPDPPEPDPEAEDFKLAARWLARRRRPLLDGDPWWDTDDEPTDYDYSRALDGNE